MLYPLSYGTVAVSLYLIVRRTQRGGTSSVPTLTLGNQPRHRCLFPLPSGEGEDRQTEFHSLWNDLFGTLRLSPKRRLDSGERVGL